MSGIEISRNAVTMLEFAIEERITFMENVKESCDDAESWDGPEDRAVWLRDLADCRMLHDALKDGCRVFLSKSR